MPGKVSSDCVDSAGHRYEAPGPAEKSGSTRSKKADPKRGSGRDDWKPTISDCEAVCGLLAEAHGGLPERPERLTGMKDDDDVEGDGIIRPATECGELALDRRFGKGNYHAIRLASVPLITETLQLARAGLATSKAATIHALLNHIHQHIHPDLSLEFLRFLPDADAMQTLTSFKGVGPKTASCVMLFCLGRNFFPVDTHVFRITQALGWLPRPATRESAFRHLNQTIPDHLKYPLHMLIFQHAQCCPSCKRITSKPPDQPLPIVTRIKANVGRKRLQKLSSKSISICPLAHLLQNCML
ncbi:hypothetical protein VP01_3997g1 [Puccinia sorghi]|uniref:HhH-GPD domain-containing protein n=1 Tax=Puccinia sorghi TaxID=27349 RepID=A0A0L6UU28_9BASI|nr:hypothetical protein VP01_3997g1 [Puccinia sorghi]